MRRSQISTLGAVIIFAISAVFILLPIVLDLDGVPFWRSAQFSDLLVSHWPNAVFLNRSVQLYDQIPLWNPTILSGYPFIADPLAGLWYPPFWLAAMFPGSVVFNLLFWLHLVWAGYGMWRFAQGEGLSDLAALVSGVVFAGAPKWIAHIGLGHIGLISAISWTPWLLLGTREAITAVSMDREAVMRRLSRNGLLLTTIFLADPRWLLPSMILLVLYSVRVLQGLSDLLRFKARAAIRWAAGTGLFALGGAAGFATVFVIFVQRSTRTLLEASAPDLFSLNWEEWVGLIIFEPEHPEKYIYLGLGATFFAVVGILFERRRSWFWYVVIILGFSISMGSNLPVLGPGFHSLPLAEMLRVPPRWFYFVVFAVAYFAGAGFEALINAPIRGRVSLFSILILILLGGSVYAITMTLGVGTLDRLLILSIPAAAMIPLVLLRRSGWLHPQPFLLASLAVLLIEFSAVNFLVLETRPATIAVSDEPDRIAALSEANGQTRLFSPSFSLDPLTAAKAGFELADGVHPLQLKSYWLYMAEAIGFAEDQYSVTLPPYPSGDPFEELPIRLDQEKLSRLNIQLIVAAYPIRQTGLRFLTGDGDFFVYQIEETRPRAWVESESGEAEEWQPAQLTYWSPNRIELIGSGPGKLVLSEIAYPGWQVFVDGRRADDLVVDGLLRGVHLSEDDHRVEFVYRPMELFIGLSLTVLTLLAAAYLEVSR